MRPLVDFLVGLSANISVLPQIAHVTDHERSHASLLQRGDESRCLLMLDLSYLLFELLELLLFGADEALAALRPLLHLAINAAVQFRLQLVAVLHRRTQESPVEDMRVVPVVGSRHVDLPQIDTCNLACWERTVERRRLVGGNRFVLRPYPMDDHRLGKFPGPGQHEWGVSFSVGE